jgi:hypothetical protein
MQPPLETLTWTSFSPMWASVSPSIKERLVQNLKVLEVLNIVAIMVEETS